MTGTFTPANHHILNRWTNSMSPENAIQDRYEAYEKRAQEIVEENEAIQKELCATSNIANEALERLEEIGEVIRPDEEFPQWRWEVNGEPIAEIKNTPKGLIP